MVQRGHEVRWYTSHRFREKIEANGARFLPMKKGNVVHPLRLEYQAEV
jgi:UDP:flavonoid glycosyltransferase YjiC (YdhE family)